MEILFSWYLIYFDLVIFKEKMEKRFVIWFKNFNKIFLEYFKGVEDFYKVYVEVLEMLD